MEFVKRILDYAVEKLISYKVRYQKKCYWSFASFAKFERAREHFRDPTECGSSSVAKKIFKRAVSIRSKAHNKFGQTWSKSITQGKTFCITCQRTGWEIHLAHRKETSTLIMSVSKKLSKVPFESFRGFWAANVFANDKTDIVYHNIFLFLKTIFLSKLSIQRIITSTLNWQRNYALCGDLPHNSSGRVLNVSKIYRNIENDITADRLNKHSRKFLKCLLRKCKKFCIWET